MEKYNWVYGENDCQNYYEVKLDKDYLCVFANKKYPDVWMSFYIKASSDITIMDKTFNDKQRKKDEKNRHAPYGGYPFPSITRILSNKNPEYMKKKVIKCYENNLVEISA
ncbi:MAG: hypothetical protein LUH21_04250 [Clostridiales bacterium]|nr:hypothetical protein [Clostridiales bacterium]